MAKAVPVNINRAAHDIVLTKWILHDENRYEDVIKPGYFNLAHSKLQQFDQIEVRLDNETEKVYLKFLVKSVNKETKIVETILIEEYDLLDES